MFSESRVLKLASQVARQESSDLYRHLEESRVLITLDEGTSMGRLAVRVLLTTLRRLPIRLYLRTANLSSEFVSDLYERLLCIAPTRPLHLIETESQRGFLHVHVGAQGPEDAIRLVPEGYGGHVLRGPKRVRVNRDSTGLGAIFTAALGAGEVFKTVVDVLPSRRKDHQHLQFCPVSLSENLNAAPDLLVNDVSLTLVGLGAVGSGIALILSELPLTGHVLLVDYERYAIENLETYSLGDFEDVKLARWKTQIAATTLSHFETTQFHKDVATLASEIDDGKQVPHQTVLTALDNVPARHEAQRLWPALIIDAGTGDTMLGICEMRSGTGPCLMCFFPERTSDISVIDSLSRVTGLATDLLMRGDEELTLGDLNGVTNEQRMKLLPLIGTKICGLAEAVGLTNLSANGYQPSAAFVSLQAACLSVGRLLARLMNANDEANLIQYDALIGPEQLTSEKLRESKTCYCQQRSNTIKAVRELRYGPSHH